MGILVSLAGWERNLMGEERILQLGELLFSHLFLLVPVK